MGAHHRDRRYVIASRTIRQAATLDPHAVCWRDGLTLAEHQQLYPNTRLHWTAGHTIRGSHTWQPWYGIRSTPPQGDWLAPEVSRCNYSHGATEGNAAREPTSGWWG